MRRNARPGSRGPSGARRAVGVLASTGLAVTGLAAAGLATAQAGAAAPTIVWGECASGALLAIQAECGMLAVPLDYAKPGGTKIKIAVSRVKALVPAKQRQGIMLANPGGPGGEGLSMSALRDIVPDDAGRAYDWIGFDPRGVGESRPRLSCDKNYAVGPRPDYTPQTQGATLSGVEKAWLAKAKKYATACGRKQPALLRHMRTTDTVRDMDMIRAALGESKINYYGFSYGTYLGQVYATTYPDRVRRMVLDGNVDARGVWYDAQLSQDRAFEKVAKRFFAWVARYDKVYKLGTTEAAVRKAYDRKVAALRARPVGRIGPAEWADAFSRAAYSESLWPQTASGFSTAVHDGDMTLIDLAYEESDTPGDDNGFAVYNAVQCTDTAWPASYMKTWRTDGFATAAKAPFLTWGNVWYNAACLYWPAPAGTPVKVDGRKAPAILLVNTTGDPATPFAGALHVRQLFPKARLIAEKGNTTHSNSLNGNACVDNAVAAYLARGTLPARKAGSVPDLQCAATPQPTPGPAELAEASTGAPQVETSAPAGDPPPPGQGSKPTGKGERYPQSDLSVLRGITGLLP